MPVNYAAHRPGAATRRDEQRPAGDRIVKRGLSSAINLLQEGRARPVSGVL